MKTSLLLKELQGQGVEIWAEGGKLRCRGGREILTERVIKILKRRKAEVFILLEKQAPAGNNGDFSMKQGNQTMDGIFLPDILPVSREQNIPLSFAQHRCWENQAADAGERFYNIPMVFKIEGKLDIDVLRQGINRMIQRQQILRTTFPIKDGTPVQEVAPEYDVEIVQEDLRQLWGRRQEETCAARIKEENRRPFDLENGPLMRVITIRLGIESYVLGVNLHHLIIDMDSLGLFLEELSIHYEAILSGNIAPFPDLPVQYADYSYWQHRYFLPNVLENRQSYWKRWLEKGLPPLDLPFDRRRPPEETFRSGRKEHRFSTGLIRDLKKLGRTTGTSLFMTVTAAFATLLHGWTGNDDIVVAYPMFTARHFPVLKPLIGFFSTAVLLRIDLGGNPSFPELLSRVRRAGFEALSKQDVPYTKVLEMAGDEETKCLKPSYRVLLNMLAHNPASYLKLPQMDITPLSSVPENMRQDLSLQVWQKKSPEGTALHGLWRYKKDLFDATTIDGQAERFQALLEAVAANPDRTVMELIGTAAEIKKRQWQRTSEPQPDGIIK
jgi:hypothetical protein